MLDAAPPALAHHQPPAPELPRRVQALLNLGHALDHMFLLIFAAAVVAMAADFGLPDWQTLMPYGAGAFLMFGLGSIPAGRLGDLWGRRRMMIVFFVGLGVSALLVAMAQAPWQVAVLLVVLGTFASIYHPVGIPLLLQTSRKPGAVIGFNGLAGNLGVAAAALVTGFVIQWTHWRVAFALPGVLSLAAAWAFARWCPAETEAPAQRTARAPIALSTRDLWRALTVMTVAAIYGGITFNLLTNGNGPLLATRMHTVLSDPAWLGTLLAAAYAVASLAQIAVGHFADRWPLRRFFMGVVLAQAPLLWLASHTSAWAFYVALVALMAVVFGAVPFSDLMITRYVDDRIRSRVAGARLAVSLGMSSLAVWWLGPLAKAWGFEQLMQGLAVLAVAAWAVLGLLPSEPKATAKPGQEPVQVPGPTRA